MKTWIALPALALMMALFAVPSANAAPGYATGDVNMRTGPGTNYRRILTVPRGQPVEIYGCRGSWCDTYYAGRRGWVSGRYLSSGQRRVYRSSPGAAAAAGIIGLGVAGAILSDRYDDDYYYYRHRPRGHWRGGPRYRDRGHYRGRSRHHDLRSPRGRADFYRRHHGTGHRGQR